MNYRILLALLVLVIGVSSADTALQTDWSDGGGVPGPVSDWGSTFDTASDCDYSQLGQLSLSTLFGETTEHYIYGKENIHSVFSVDIDGDGDCDILSAAFATADISFYENVDGTGCNWIEHTIDSDFAGAHCVHSVDIDNDGDMDVLGAGDDADITAWYENVDGIGTTWTKRIIDSNCGNAVSVYGSDIDGDGDMDVLSASHRDNDISFWENEDGIGTSWVEHKVDPSHDGPSYACCYDIDGDGDMDVVATSDNLHHVSWWRNENGIGTSWTKIIIGEVFNGAKSADCADIDGDGDMDVLAAAYESNMIAWWENEYGTGTTWTRHTITESFASAIKVLGVDINNNGDVDVLGAAAIGDEITLWENNGYGTSWTEHVIASDFNAVSCICTSDIDGNGTIDVVGGASTDDYHAWWEVLEFCEESSLESSVLDLNGFGIVDWGSITWNSDEPENTDVAIQVRASDDYSSMGSWSSEITESGTDLSEYLDCVANYFQYKVILSTTDEMYSPTFEDITIDWEAGGGEIITITEPDYNTVWHHLDTNTVVEWEYPVLLSGNTLFGDSVRIEMYKGGVKIAEYCWWVPNAGSYTRLETIPESWGEGPDFQVKVIDNLDNYGMSQYFAIEPQGIEGEYIDSYQLLPIEPNPATGSFTIRFSVPEASHTSVNIFDLSGRLVTSVVSQEMVSGTYRSQVSGLPAGVYICRMESGTFEASERVVVIR